MLNLTFKKGSADRCPNTSIRGKKMSKKYQKTVVSNIKFVVFRMKNCFSKAFLLLFTTFFSKLF